MQRHLALLAILGSMIGASVDVGAQSLAEVARREEERRKTVKTPAKVYTNKDLPPAGAAPAESPATASAAVSEAASRPDQAIPDRGPDLSGASESDDQRIPQEPPREDYAAWGARLKELEATLERNLTYVDALQSRINSLTTDFVNRDDPAQRAVIAADRQRATAELERLKKQTQDDRAAIDKLHEDARRAGVPPGWLR
jgi:hypothetical protein